MNRKEMLEKLKNIQPTAFPTVATMDMGLEFDVLTPEGVYTYLGSIGEWPVWFFDRLDNSKIMELKTKIDKNIELTADDFKDTDLYSFAKTLQDRDSVDFNKSFKNVIDYEYSEELKFIYVYCDLGQWEPEVTFYGTEEEITEEFFSSFPGSTEWESLDDNWLSTYCEEFDEHEEGLPFNTSEDIFYDEDYED